jgi:hypothetical protein
MFVFFSEMGIGDRKHGSKNGDRSKKNSNLCLCELRFCVIIYLGETMETE